MANHGKFFFFMDYQYVLMHWVLYFILFFENHWVLYLLELLLLFLIYTSTLARVTKTST